jgi:hypothetical protein
MAATVSFSLTTMMVQPWYVDAGSPQVVNGGAVVTLNGLALTPGFTGATFSYQWSPAQTPDASTPDWILTSPTSAITTFVAPIVSGPNRPLPFTLTANVTASGLMPTQNVGATSVLVQDSTPPHAIGTSIDGTGTNGPYSLYVDFDEAIDPTTTNGVFITVPTGASYSAPSVISRSIDPTGTRVWLAMRNSILGDAYVLNVANVHDASPQHNNIATVTFSYTCARPWSSASVSQGSSTAEPRPGLVVRPVPGSKLPQALVGARKESQPWFLAPFDPVGCAASGCNLSDDSAMPMASLSAQPIRSHRGFLLGTGTAVMQIQLRDYSGDAGIAYTRDFSGGWTPLPAPPGQLVTRYDGGLGAAYAQNALYLAAYDIPSQSWSIPDAGVLSMSAADFPGDSASDPLVAAGAGSPGNNMFAAARTSKTGQLRYFENAVSTGVWSTDCCGVSSGNAVMEVRVSPGVSNVFATYLRAGGALETALFGGGVSNGATNFVPQPVTGYDAVNDPTPSQMYFATSANGQLQLQAWQLPGSGSWTYFPGPDGGTVAPYLNNDPTCWADQPEMALLYGKLYVTWQERCGAGPWKVYVRTLN